MRHRNNSIFWKYLFIKLVNLNRHSAYQKQLVILLHQYYPDASSRFDSSLWNTIGEFFSMDLSQVDIIMAGHYSVFGPTPRFPSDMLRSYMLSLVMKKTNYIDWSEMLKTPPLLQSSVVFILKILRELVHSMTSVTIYGCQIKTSSQFTRSL